MSSVDSAPSQERITTSGSTATQRFAGKTAIVTGAGSGIGRATAVRLAAEGARVIGVDISQPRLADLGGELTGTGFTPIAGDIGSEETVHEILAAANGRVDALANVAGIMDGFLPPHELDDATWERVMNTNVTAIMRLTRAVLSLMRKAKSGSIVNVTSEAGVGGRSGVLSPLVVRVGIGRGCRDRESGDRRRPATVPGAESSRASPRTHSSVE